MQRMCTARANLGIAFLLASASLFSSHAHGDLIRSSPSRSFPDIAGDIVGTQTYTYDPVTQTGTFHLVNAPHLISLGPASTTWCRCFPTTTVRSPSRSI